MRVSDKNIGRLSLYRFLLDTLSNEGITEVYSHELATAANCSAAQVRRDLMAVKYPGSPAHGYAVDKLVEGIDNFLNPPEGVQVCLVGVGNLGRAMLDYFTSRRPKLHIIAAFDCNAALFNRVIQGVRCYPMTRLGEIIHEKNIKVGIITVPTDAAQEVAELLIEAGVAGLLNFAPIRLKTPTHTFVENIELTMSLEKVAYFSNVHKTKHEARKP